ncbi:MAG: DUF1906 domain-containing protein [Acidimicrobiaceae bacterium]|nr:DUF1906 domain-containing protein [Acidimicrobiaceae bacterium]
MQYGPVSVDVPSSWPVINLTGTKQCALLNQHAVYLGTQAPDAACPAHAFGKTGAVQIQPLTSASDAYRAAMPTTIGGQSARVDPASTATQTAEAALPQANALVSVSWGDSSTTPTSQATASQIQGSISTSSGSLPPSATTRSSHRGKARASTARLTAFSKGLLAPRAQASATVGRGFDTCSAPSLGQMQAWLGSPYRTVGVYIGGANAACAQPNLTPSWIATVEDQGWSIIPIYVGLEAPCAAQGGLASINAASAASQGAQAASDAVTDAQGVGLGRGTPIFFDMEAYGTGCSAAVTTFLSAWNAQLTALGYSSGVYESTSNIADLVRIPAAQPDILWFAQWDGIATVSNSSVPSYLWTGNRRMKQYLGGHVETYGGVAIDIDSDFVDAVLNGPTFPSPDAWQSSSALYEPVADQVQVYAARVGNSTYERFYSYSSNSWSGWLNLGGVVTSGSPVAFYEPVANQLQVYQVGPGGSVYEDFYSYSSNRWSGWFSLGGQFSGTPAAFYQPETNEVQVYATSTGGAAEVDVYSYGSNRWSGWINLGSGMSGSPAAFYQPEANQVQVYEVGPGLSLYEDFYSYSSNSWSGWLNLGGQVSGTPAAFYEPQANQVQVYVRSTGGAPYEDFYSYSANRWSGWLYLGGQMNGSPAAIYDQGANQVQVYAVGTDGAAYEDFYSYSSNSWSGWFGLGGLVNGSLVAFYQPVANQVQVYAVGINSSVYEDFYAGSWSGWIDLGGSVSGFSP